MSLYKLATKIIDEIKINESRLPTIQSLLLKRWGVAKAGDCEKYSEWPGTEGKYVKFWLLNDGSLIHVPYAHATFGYHEGSRGAGHSHPMWSSKKREDMINSGAAVISVSEEEINIENRKKLTDKQQDTIVNLYNKYGFERVLRDDGGMDVNSFGNFISGDQLRWLLGASKREMKLVIANEATTMSDISYLPTQLGTVRAMITDLAREKPDWDLEILNDLDPRQFIIKDRAKFSVPKKHWGGFLKIFGNKINGKLLKLGNMKESLDKLYDIEERRLFEANEADMKKLRLKLKTKLHSLFYNKEFIKLQEMAWNWYSVFGVSEYTTTSAKSIAVSNEKIKHDIQRIYGQLLREYGEDRGNLEMLIGALSDKTELNTFAIFRNFDHIFGTRMNSSYEGYDLGFEYLIDFMYNPSQSIYVADEELRDAIEEDVTSGIKVAHNTIWPIGGLFKHDIFWRIKNVIDDLITKEGNENEH